MHETCRQMVSREEKSDKSREQAATVFSTWTDQRGPIVMMSIISQRSVHKHSRRPSVISQNTAKPQLLDGVVVGKLKHDEY